MKSHLECIPCYIRQSLDTARKLRLDEARVESLLRETLVLVSKLDWDLPPPVIGRDIHRVIRALTGNDDPYREQKVADTSRALEILPDLEKAVATSQWPFRTAVQFAIAGNAIDLGAKSETEADVKRAFENALLRSVDETAVSRLEEAVFASKQLLFLTDNAGEMVFDRPLLDLIGPEKLTVVVRGGPVINDATMADARRSGLTEKYKVVTSGSTVPGTWLEDCCAEFIALFESSDLIIARGQGNYEGLSAEKGCIAFLFLVKCALVSNHVGLPTDTAAILFHG